ncbi:hypothetical protein VUJ46_19895 [Chryseobacterium sp. MYb264]|uniref:hypothetical protein n=1 Tax=Chryseobacterium sp. MYb264 TaxID=2745153 RepID=UPI002E11B5B0|nr:hypothetical protein VUJ46_19895 [Chryseobacterium sp. MYb264]
MEKEEDYFYEVNKELSKANRNQEKISEIYRIELGKYKRTNELKYLISSKFAETFIDIDERPKKVSLIYELLRINDGDYDFITAYCKLSLAHEFEDTSPKLGLQFLNEAIKIEEKDDKKVLLPHLYHAKGRWYFQHNNFSLARIYFYKALKTFKKDDMLYIASMYNNFGLCDYEMKDTESSISNIKHGIEILEGKTNPTEEERRFTYTMKGNLGEIYFNKDDYVSAVKYLEQEFHFNKDQKKREDNQIRNTRQLLEIYKTTGEKNKEIELINYLLALEPRLKNTNQRILLCEILQHYYSDKNDLQQLKQLSEKLVELNKKSNEETVEDLDNISDILNGYIIKNINQEFDYKVEMQERNTVLLIVLVIILISFFTRSILKIRKKNEKEKEYLTGLKNELENNNESLEKDILLKEEKIKNLHLNLNLKIETEKAFLENLKKIRKSKNVNATDTVRDLFFQMNNLLQIDEKNHEFIDDSSSENREFIKKLSERFPQLTAQELKLCVYFRLNLSSKEVSLLEKITPGSVRVYKAKIKAKMKLDKEENLPTFLGMIV